MLFGEKKNKFDLNLTYYKTEIYEYHSDLPLNNIFKFLLKKEHCIMIRINKNIFLKMIGANFIFKIVGRQIFEKYFPVIANEDFIYTRYQIDLYEEELL